MNPLLLALLRAGIISQADADRINRQLDPVAARAWADQQMALAVQNGLSAQQQRLVGMIRQTNGNLSPAMLDDFWRAEDERLFAALRPTIDDVASERAITMAVTAGADANTWRTINQAVLDWVGDYYTNADVVFVGSVPNLNLTSRTEFARSFLDWQRGELDSPLQGLQQLIDAIQPTFGPERSERIAVTETTRIIVESQREAASQDEFVTGFRLLTAADERVCPICGPVHRQFRPKAQRYYEHPSLGAIQGPPFHVRCRCQEIELTDATRDHTPPEERYRWSADAYAAHVDNLAAARADANALTLMGA